jgi:hypothetical protein
MTAEKRSRGKDQIPERVMNRPKPAWKNGPSAPCRAEGLAADLLGKTDERENPSQGND